MDALSTNMQRLVMEAEASINDLIKLEEKLKSIHEVVSREDKSIFEDERELWRLWTFLGGNRDELRRMADHHMLLKGVNEYRGRALSHVEAALQIMETMDANMEELRQRTAAPRLVGDAIPIDVHIKSLKSGLERLKGIRTSAKQMKGNS
jgi:hypothetical protein